MAAAIRGLIPAMLVQQLDQEFKPAETSGSICRTSTGGIIALGLLVACPFPLW